MMMLWMMLMMLQMLLLLCAGADAFAATNVAPPDAATAPIVATVPVATIAATFAALAAPPGYLHDGVDALTLTLALALVLTYALAPTPSCPCSRSCSLCCCFCC